MSGGFRPAVDRISSLPWESASLAQHGAARIFSEIGAGVLLADLKHQLASLIDPGRSIEKTTHYKWFVAEDPRGFEVWLHDYKPRTHRRVGHASVPHNHRFWLTSIVLRGGFVDTRYRRTTATGNKPEWIEPEASRAMAAGATMVIDPEEIHSLSELKDGTLTLIVQSKPVRNYSEVFEDGAIRRYSDLGAKLLELDASLRPS